MTTDIHGWIVIDKPLGMTSMDVIKKMRRLLKVKKMGHGGTLDPLASGLLPVALNEATKTVSYTMDHTKVYQFTVKWGEQRTTDDGEGDVLTSSDKRPSMSEIKDALSAFTGVIDQVPPKYSAILINGKRAYALARDDKEVDLKARPVRIDALEWVASEDQDHATFQVTCGKGTYVRSLARDLALFLGTVGHVTVLRRLEVGPFTVSDAISLEKLEELSHLGWPKDVLRPVDSVLADIPALELTTDDSRRFRNGQKVSVTKCQKDATRHLQCGDHVRVLGQGKLSALGKVDEGQVVPVRIFNI